MGNTLSPLAGVFVDAACTQFDLLTPGTISILLGSEAADIMVKISDGW